MLQYYYELEEVPDIEKTMKLNLTKDSYSGVNYGVSFVSISDKKTTTVQHRCLIVYEL